MSEASGCKRIHFFEGFFTTAEDWNDAEAYHLDKRRLHNRVFHQPGVVPILGGGLVVTARGRGDLSFEVAPGFALDAEGREIVLRDPVVRVVQGERLKLPQTVYVGIRFVEEPTDFIAYPDNPRFKGHRRIEETCRVEVVSRPPELDGMIELARVRLEEGVREIRNAVHAEAPGAGEIDLRYVPRAGVAGAHLPVVLHVGLTNGLGELQLHAAALAGAGVQTAAFVRHLAATASMLLSANALGPANLCEVLAGVVETQREMSDEVERLHPNVAARKGFGEYRKSLEALRRRMDARPRDAEGCAEVVRLLRTANQSLALVAREKSTPAAEVQPAAGERVSWKDIVVFSRPFPPALDIDGSSFTQVDHIRLVDEESAKAHKLVIEGHKDSWKSRQHFSYPDQVEVSDAGVAFVGGQSKFVVRNVRPGRDLVMIKRYDAYHGEHICEVLADGRTVGTWKAMEADRRHRWRNHYFLVPGTFVSGESLEIVQKAVSAERDINMFQLWFYQPA